METMAMESMKFRTALPATLVAVAALAGCRSGMPGTDGGVDAAAAFARLKAMAGSYQATLPGDEGTVPVTYEVTSGGHALLEKLFAGADHEMVTMYYLEGRDLALVHYCSIGNRPHMRLDRARSTRDDLVFAFDAGATDLDPAKDAHIHSARIRFTETGAMESEWTFWSGGKEDHAKAFMLSKDPGLYTPPAR